MSASDAFGDFEHSGWDNASVALSYDRNLSEVTSGCIDELFRSAELKAAHRILDVACGAGYVAAAARSRGATACGLDFSAAQVRLAQQTNPGIRFVEGDAQALPFAEGDFDIVFSAFGFPHLPHPECAAAEAYRVLKPGGRLAYASWCEAFKCVAFAMVYDAIRTHGRLDVGLPPGPNFFSFGTPGYASEMLGRAGFKNVTTAEVPLVWRVAEPDQLIDAFFSGTVRAAATLKGQRPDDLVQIRRQMRERIAEFKEGSEYRVPAPALVAVGQKPV